MAGPIAVFETDGGVAVNPYGGIVTYGGAAAPMYNGSTGNLVITESAAATASAQYVGVVIYFNGNSAGKDCVDGTGKTGIQFMLSGTISAACTMQFSINDSEHEDAAATMDPKASGPAGAYAPQLPLTPMTTATLVKVPFTGAGSPMGGMPPAGIDVKKLTGIQWQFSIPAGTGMCMANITVSNVAYY
jgi:hypothetical protein